MHYCIQGTQSPTERKIVDVCLIQSFPNFFFFFGVMLLSCITVIWDLPLSSRSFLLQKGMLRHRARRGLHRIMPQAQQSWHENQVSVDWRKKWRIFSPWLPLSLALQEARITLPHSSNRWRCAFPAPESLSHAPPKHLVSPSIRRAGPLPSASLAFTGGGISLGLRVKYKDWVSDLFFYFLPHMS